jgi:hypothetical protein
VSEADVVRDFQTSEEYRWAHASTTADLFGLDLALPVLRSWDRPNGRARVFDLNGPWDETQEARP